MNVFRRVLVPVDGSAASEQALIRAIAIAADQQADIHFVHVIQHRPEQPLLGDAEYAAHVAADILLDHAVQLACEKDLLGTSAVLVTAGRQSSIAQEILCAAVTMAADLIVCGVPGTGACTTLPGGSVAEELAACCRIPLMLEHGHEPARRDEPAPASASVEPG